MDTPAKRLRFARKLRKLSQVQLALAAGVATGTVGNIEAGTRGIKGCALSLAKVLAVDPGWLATGEGEPPNEGVGNQISLRGFAPPPASPPSPSTLQQALQIIDDALAPLDAPARRTAAHMLTSLEYPGSAGLVASMLFGAIESMSHQHRAA